jgi:hypothetical protein
MILTGKPKNLEKTCPYATLPTTNPTWTELCVNQGLCSELPHHVYSSLSLKVCTLSFKLDVLKGENYSSSPCLLCKCNTL